MPKSDRWVNAGDQMPYIQRDRDKKKSNENAQRTAGWYSDDAYMSEVGKEGIKRQQEKMRQTADDEMAKEGTKHKIPSYKKGGKVRKTGLALVHKGEKVIPKNKVNAQRKKG